jgi:hypothetical protein
MSILSKLKKVLGALTDILLIFRKRGWVSRKNQIDYERRKKK